MRIHRPTVRQNGRPERREGLRSRASRRVRTASQAAGWRWRWLRSPPAWCRLAQARSGRRRKACCSNRSATTGEAIYPAFEGWGPTKDGSAVLLLGYFNRNKDQSIDIPIGPDNRIEPGGPDFGQPTHFHPGRQYGVFCDPDAEGLRHQAPDVDAHRQRPHLDGDVLDEPAVLDRLLQEPRERQRAAAHQVLADGTGADRSAARALRARADRHGRAAGHADGVGRRSAADDVFESTPPGGAPQPRASRRRHGRPARSSRRRQSSADA